jgi:hypothetical protein
MRRGLPVTPTRRTGTLRVTAPAPATSTVPPPGGGPPGPLPLTVPVFVVPVLVVVVLVTVIVGAVVALIQRADTGIDRPRARSATHVGLLRMRAELFG